MQRAGPNQHYSDILDLTLYFPPCSSTAPPPLPNMNPNTHTNTHSWKKVTCCPTSLVKQDLCITPVLREVSQ